MTTRRRIESVDVVRGLVMILMALDHVRDFFGDLAADPTALAATTPALFLTRWITHFCAPAFFLLTGTGAFLALGKMSKRDLSRYLVGRGIWLIFLELVVVRFALQFNARLPDHHHYGVVGAGLGDDRAGGPDLAAGLGRCGLRHRHNRGTQSAGRHFRGQLRRLGAALVDPACTRHHPEQWPLGGSDLLCADSLDRGDSAGLLLRPPVSGRCGPAQGMLLWLGIGFCTAFLVLRLANIYGDPAAWARQRSPLWTLISFLNLTKYPPSLLFLLMTLGPVLLLLRAFDDRIPQIFQPALTIGKIPLFFFILHFFLIHLLAVLASWLRYGEIGGMFRSPDLAHFPFIQPPAWGASLPVIYAIWLAVIFLMYPLCRWYAGVKQRNTAWWLGYL